MHLEQQAPNAIPLEPVVTFGHHIVQPEVLSIGFLCAIVQAKVEAFSAIIFGAQYTSGLAGRFAIVIRVAIGVRSHSYRSRDGR